MSDPPASTRCNPGAPLAQLPALYSGQDDVVGPAMQAAPPRDTAV